MKLPPETSRTARRACRGRSWGRGRSWRSNEGRRRERCHGRQRRTSRRSWEPSRGGRRKRRGARRAQLQAAARSPPSPPSPPQAPPAAPPSPRSGPCTATETPAALTPPTQASTAVCAVGTTRTAPSRPSSFFETRTQTRTRSWSSLKVTIWNNLKATNPSKFSRSAKFRGRIELALIFLCYALCDFSLYASILFSLSRKQKQTKRGRCGWCAWFGQTRRTEKEIERERER